MSGPVAAPANTPLTPLGAPVTPAVQPFSSAQGILQAAAPPVGATAAAVSRLRLSRGMVVVGALILLFCFWSPLVSCGQPGSFGAMTITGPQLVEAAVQQSTVVDGAEAQLWFAGLLVIPLTALLLIFLAGRSLLRDTPAAPSLVLPAVGLGMNAIALVGLWLYIKYTNAQLTDQYSFTGSFDIIRLTWAYWMMWLGVFVAAGGLVIERDVGRSSGP